MHIILFDRADWRKQLYPLVWTRPVSDLRVGILTIAEKWSKWLGHPHAFLTEDFLQVKYPLGLDTQLSEENDFLVVRGNCCPDIALLELADKLRKGEGVRDEHGFILFKTDGNGIIDLDRSDLDESAYQWIDLQQSFVQIRYAEDVFLQNGKQIANDFDLLTKGRSSAPLSGSNRFLGDQIFAEEGAKAEFSIFNSLEGPIYLGKNSEVWENSAIRGAFALGEGSHIKMGTKVYSNVSIGPHCRMGGELNTSVVWGYSSKGHDGFLGHAVLGEWCNWGADSNNSNLKNNYSNVKVFDYKSGGYRNSGQQFYGVVMGDHSKCAINTSFNTGTVIGVGGNVFGAGFPSKFIPDFSWGASQDNLVTHDLERMFETAALVYERRNRIFDLKEQELLRSIFNQTAKYRLG